MKLTREWLEAEFVAQANLLGLETEVLSDGPINADVVIIGEGPGETEIRQGKPFVGGAGSLLWNSLRPHGINRLNAYVTNVVKRQISLSRKGNEKHVVQREELERWIGMLQWELGHLPNARVMILLGNYALEAVSGLSGVTKWRGSVLDSVLPNGKDGWLVVTINPAYALRELRLEPVFMLDCNKAAMVIQNKFKPHQIEELVNPSYKEARAFIRDLKKSPKPFAFDVEVINNETACFGLANDAHRAMCINLRDATRNRFSAREETDILCDLQSLCDSHRVIAQNGSFDSYWTRLRDWLCVEIWFDILLAHHALYPQLPHNLGFLTAQYTNHPFYKDEGKGWKEGGDLDSFWRYNCKDAAITFAVYQRLERELQQQGMDKFFFSHVMRAQPHLISATVHGVAVDVTVKEQLREQISEDVAELKAEFHRIVHKLTEDQNYYPNPDSWPQMKELFFTHLKLQGKGTSTDETNRNYIMENPATPPLAKEMLVALGRYKEENKFLGTYANSRVSKDGRFRCEYKQYGVASAPGRLSSAQLLDGDGGNMQNQPVRARGMYVADPGCLLLYFDLSQAEAQVVSFRADIATWKQQYAQAKIDGKYDSHRALASEMFKVEYDQVPVTDWDENGKPTIRYVAKRCRHGLNYRMERWRLAEVTGLPYHQAARAFAVYHSITPELRRWWEEEERQFKATKSISNAFGRRLKVIQRLDDDVLKSIIAFYPQSTIGDKITQTWYMCEDDDEWPHISQARVCIDVHDNLVAVATPKVAKTCLKVMKKHAESPIWIQDVFKKRKHEPLSIPCELKISYPTVWDQKANKGKGGFVRNAKGLHRWSNMEKVVL